MKSLMLADKELEQKSMLENSQVFILNPNWNQSQGDVVIDLECGNEFSWFAFSLV
ncbi:hypothetical protein LguiB_032224 [Lonicera macranthoides]